MYCTNHILYILIQQRDTLQYFPEIKWQWITIINIVYMLPCDSLYIKQQPYNFYTQVAQECVQLHCQEISIIPSYPLQMFDIQGKHSGLPLTIVRSTFDAVNAHKLVCDMVFVMYVYPLSKLDNSPLIHFLRTVKEIKNYYYAIGTLSITFVTSTFHIAFSL